MRDAFCLAYCHWAGLQHRAVEDAATKQECHHPQPEPNTDTPARLLGARERNAYSP
jgi:hypothetical protein